MPRLFAVALLTLATVASASERLPAEEVRIEYLLAVVASLQDAQFIRNGTTYDSKAAVDHLRTKLRAAGSRVQTAEDFIRDCASKSSISGQPYEIRFADGDFLAQLEFRRRAMVRPWAVLVRRGAAIYHETCLSSL